MKVAIVTGITGQDGSLLAKFLLNKGYKVIGIQRRSSAQNFIMWRLKEIGILTHKNLYLFYGDLTDISSLQKIFKANRPDEIYNLAAQSFVAASWKMPFQTLNVTGSGAIRVFEAAYACCPEARIYQASSSEMFGGCNVGSLLDENSQLDPKSPYAAAKVLAHNMAHVYRDSYGMFISCGILFNHESEYRGIEFVTRKITDAVARIHLGKIDHLDLGNIRSYRDWGYAPNYVEAMWKMLQYHDARDFVIATGKKYSVEQFLIMAFNVIEKNWRGYVRINKSLLRPNDVHCLLGDNSLAFDFLKWQPTTSFEDMVKIMVKKDIERLS